MPDRRRGELLEPAVTMSIDALALETAFLLTYWWRFHSGVWLVPLGVPPLGPYVLASLAILLTFLGIFYAQGLYAERGGRRIEADFVALFRGVVLGSLLVLAAAFFVRALTFSRSFFGLFFWTSWIFLCGGRVVARRLLGRWLRRGMRRQRVLLAGSNPMRERLLRAVAELPGLSIHTVGWLQVPGEEDPQPPALPCLGTLAEIREVVQRHQVDRVILTLHFDQLPLIAGTAEALGNLATDVQFVPDLFALRTSKMRLTEVAGIPFISVREIGLSGAGRIVKRTFDLVLAAVGLLALAPLLLALAALVKLTSRGPVLYKQPRVGRNGREFAMLKFRSMRVDAEAPTGPVWTVADDPRVTPLGRFLRRWSLDELPQLWNVLRGDMSLVGPRPERRVFVEQFSRQMPRYFERHRVKSGLTGWAQVNGLRGNTSIEERTLYDLHYVENWSVWLDIRILLMTVHHLVRGDNAY